MKTKMFVMMNIPQLIAQHFRAIDVYYRHVSVRMSVNPVINIMVVNKIMQLRDKGAVDAAIFK